MAEKSASEVKNILQTESNTPDNAQFAEEEYVEEELDKGIKLAYLNTLNQNNAERKKYARHIFFFTCGWATSIVGIILLDGFSWKCFYLSDSVLITLITTTTVNFFGFFLLVTKYLFNAKAIEKPNPFIK